MRFPFVYASGVDCSFELAPDRHKSDLLCPCACSHTNQTAKLKTYAGHLIVRAVSLWYQQIADDSPTSTYFSIALKRFLGTGYSVGLCSQLLSVIIFLCLRVSTCDFIWLLTTVHPWMKLWKYRWQIQPYKMGSVGDEQAALLNDILYTPNHPDLGLEPEKFREAVRSLTDLVLDYHKNVGKRQAYPNVKPGNIL